MRPVRNLSPIAPLFHSFRFRKMFRSVAFSLLVVTNTIDAELQFNISRSVFAINIGITIFETYRYQGFLMSLSRFTFHINFINILSGTVVMRIAKLEVIAKSCR